MPNILSIVIEFACILQSCSTLQGQQIKTAVYGDDIGHYVGKLILLDTYLISAEQVKILSTSYSRSIHNFYWILDITVKHVNQTDKLEKLLPPPINLNITTLDDITQMTPTSSTKIGTLFLPTTGRPKFMSAHTHTLNIFFLFRTSRFLRVVIRCSPSKYARHTQK